MKLRALLLIVLAAAVFVPSAALAQSTSNVGYDKGFFIKNDEDTFNLKVNGRLQLKGYYTKATTIPAQGQFQIRRARLTFNAGFYDTVNVGFTLQHAIGSAAGTDFQTVNVSGATASVKVVDPFIVTVGMVGLPLDMMSEMSSAWYLLPEAPLTNTQNDGITAITPLRPSFGAPDGLGINFSGGYWKFFYSLSVVNGATSPTSGIDPGVESNYAISSNGKKFSFGARVGFNILDPVPSSMTDFECSETPKLTVSVGSDYQGSRTDPTTNANIKYLWTSTLGLGLRWGGFSLTTEGYYRKTRITSLGTAAWARPNLTDIGYYAAVGYYAIPKKLEVAAQAGQIIRQGPSNDSWQFGGGLNYYVFDNNLKLQLAYTLTTDFDDLTGTQTKKIHIVQLMGSAMF